MKPSILIVDDEEHMLDLLSMILEEEFTVTTASNGEMALDLIDRHSFDLCLLDIMMPGINGLDILRKLQKEGRDLPVIFITARVSPEERVTGLESGADDYITKPFEPSEVVARVKTILRRTKNYAKVHELESNDIRINLAAREVWVKGKELKLTPIEFKLLTIFIRHPNQAFSREHLLERVWGYTFSGDARTVDSHIKNLREKLQLAGCPGDIIQTVWGYGYKWGVR